MLNWIKSLKKKKESRGKSRPSLRPSSRSSQKAVQKKRNQSASTASKSAAAHAGPTKVRILSRGEHGISRNNIDSHALKVLYRLHKAGFHACLVGGAVRDLLIGVTPKDFDVATDATPEEVNKLFRNCRIIGRRFRLAHVHFGRQIIEVATYRANHDLSQLGIQDENGRIVRDNVFGDLSDDVWRRDFTANALYYDISDFSVIDFVGGFDDIKNNRLHLIGDAETRYREDPVRMLRALRFAAKLGFEIDEASRVPIHSLGYLLEDIPAARLYEEALKFFHSGHAVRSFELLLEFDLLKYLFPEAAKSIAKDESVKRMLTIAMQSTDDRIRKDLRVTPAFLLAALLWHAVNSRVKEYTAKGMPYSVAIQKVATKVLSQQSKSVSIPKRFTSTMRDIWGLQTRFHYRSGKRAMSVLEHEKFRAGYDFLCIRVEAGEGASDAASDAASDEARNELEKDCKWWTDIQTQTAEQQKNALFSSSRKGGHGKGGSGKAKKKRSSAKKKSSKTASNPPSKAE